MSKICAKCKGEMIPSYNKDKFYGKRYDGVCDGTDSTRYMCKECGYIEEYADDPKFLNKKTF